MIVKKRLNFFDRLILWISYVSGAALLISYLAPYTDPRTIWIIAFFGLAYPPLLLVNGILIVYWLLRKKIYLLVPVLAVLIGWTILFNNIGFHKDSDITAKPVGDFIRILTYNVHSFMQYGVKPYKSSRHDILALVNKQQPDIVGMQEYFSELSGRNDITDSIKRMTGAEYAFVKVFDNNSDRGVGMAIFSKFPIIANGVIRLTEGLNPNQCIYADINRNGKVFRFYSVHLRSIGFDVDDYKYLDSVSKEGKADLQSSKKIGGKLKRAFLKRSEQVGMIRQHAAACPYPYIISGDFNDTPSSYAVNQMAKGLKNAFREKGSGLGRSYNGDFPNYQIDYVLTSPQFSVGTYKIIEEKLSDHYPVRTDLQLSATYTKPLPSAN